MGVSMNLHYCHGEVDSVEFFVDEGTCGCHAGAEPTHCCFDKNYKYELDSEQFFTAISSFNFEVIEFVSSSYFTSLFNLNTPSTFVDNLAHAPPLLSVGGVPVRILHAVFRI